MRVRLVVRKCLQSKKKWLPVHVRLDVVRGCCCHHPDTLISEQLSSGSSEGGLLDKFFFGSFEVITRARTTSPRSNKPSNSSKRSLTTLHCFLVCMREVKGCLSSNSIFLNEKKVEIIVFDSHVPRGQLADIFGPLATSLSDTVRNFGVLLESSFKLHKQVSSVVQSSFYQLRQMSKAKHYILQMDLDILIHAFVTSKLDYCKSLYLGLQSCLLAGTRRFDSITPILAAHQKSD